VHYHRLASTATAYDFAAFRDAVDAALATKERTLAVDLDEIGFLDAAVIRELIRALRRLRDRGGNLSVEATRPGVLTSLRATGLDRVFRTASAA
jgi:anti-anti-sigma factor